jgi:quercetin dioxygenase-like cupin family protein
MSHPTILTSYRTFLSSTDSSIFSLINILMANTKKNPITVGANEGRNISVVGDTYRVIISGKDTGGAFAAIDMLVPPGGGPGPHAHPGFEECFYVIDGEIEVMSESGTYLAGKGSFVNIPKGGIVHCFKNKTQQIAHLLCYVTPAGLDAFFEEIGTPVDYGQFLPAPHIDDAYAKELALIAGKYGQEIFPPDFLG